MISPRCCVVCGRRLAPTERSLCSVCLLHAPRTTFQFTPYDNDVAQLFWGQMTIEKAASWIYYEPHSEMAQLIYRLKYDSRPDIGRDIGRTMASEMLTSGFFDDIDALLPVPLASKRLRQRGYNQSEELARGISDITGLPVINKAISRVRFRQSQTSLSRQERRENVDGLFVVKNQQALEGRHILLIDDVCTTGATLMAVGRVIEEILGAKISLLTLGYTKK